MEILILVVALVAGVTLLSPRFVFSLPSWHSSSILFGALLVQVVFVAFPPPWMSTGMAMFIYLATQAGVAVFLLLNRAVKGIWLVAFGLLLNASVITLNGAMPVSSAAIDTAGAESLQDERHLEHGVHLRNEPMTESTRLAGFADVVPVPGLRKVVSVGDIILMLGLISITLQCVTRTTPKKELCAGS